ncbi:MAG: acyltransferase [Legionellaceae bacterium]|nr:acyltransferase [Legionellaceae bacterium]
MIDEKFPMLSNKQSCYFDLLRFIAVQLVVLGHLLSFMHIVVSVNYAFGIYIYIQNLGVVLFFILSGYLISYSTYSKMTFYSYTFKNFFLDRFFRIYVTFIPCLIFITVLDYFMPSYQYSAAFNIRTFIGNLFMLQDFPNIIGYPIWDLIKEIVDSQITSFGSARPLWTLGVEWWLYMAFGWFILKILPLNGFVGRSLSYTSLFIKLSVFSLLLIVPFYNLVGRGDGLTVTWLLGSMVFFSMYYRYTPLKMSFLGFAVGNCMCFYLLVLLHTNLHTFYDPRISIVMVFWFAINLVFSNQINLDISEQVKKKSRLLFKVMGGYSYALYLVHYSIIQFFVNVYGQENHKYIVSSAAFLISNIVALMMYILFDKHHRKIQKYFLLKYNLLRKESMVVTNVVV